MAPAARIVVEALDAPAVYDAFVLGVSEGYLDALGHVDQNSPFFRIFMHRYAGAQITHGLILESPGAFPPDGPIAVAITETAKRLGVSNMHLRRMFADAEKEGLLSRIGQQSLLLTEAGREAVDHIYATQLIVFLSGAAKALRACPNLAAPAA
jgi:hypothetical protein